MKDKLIIIATVQYVIEQMKMLLSDAGDGKGSVEKRGSLKAFGFMLIQFHFAITGDHWQHSPKELMSWMIRYCKDEADKLEDRAKIPEIKLN